MDQPWSARLEHWRRAGRRFLRHRPAVFGLAVLSLIILISVLAPLVAPHDPIAQDLANRLKPGFWTGNWENPLGTDKLGRDLLSRIIYAGRVSLTISVMSVVASGVLGTTLGLASGYIGGRFDLIVMRIADILQSLPVLILALAVIAALGPGLTKAMVAISLSYVAPITRIVRAQTIALRSIPYIEAAQAIGAGHVRIVTRHMLPNIMAPLIVYLTLMVASSILYSASMGFLGLGAQPPMPEWGAMLGDGKDQALAGNWWLVTFPGVMIALTVIAVNFAGDGLRDLLDPTS